MPMNSVNKAISTVNSVVKRSTKAFASALPIITVAGNVAIAAEQNPTSISGFLNSLTRRYGGVDIIKGELHLEDAWAGSGSLLFTSAVAYLLKQFL